MAAACAVSPVLEAFVNGRGPEALGRSTAARPAGSSTYARGTINSRARITATTRAIRGTRGTLGRGMVNAGIRSRGHATAGMVSLGRVNARARRATYIVGGRACGLGTRGGGAGEALAAPG